MKGKKLDLNVDAVALEGCEEDNKPQLVFDVLKKNKIELLTINFSGGGDSGGADDWILPGHYRFRTDHLHGKRHDHAGHVEGHPYV